MNYSKIFLFVFSLGFCFHVSGQNAKHSTKGKTKVEYTINDTAVNVKKFDEFLKSLKEVEGTWYCAETKTGGRTGYNAKDKNGIVYEYMSETDSNKSINSIRLKKELK